MTFVTVCSVDDLAPGDVRRIENGEQPIALVNLDGRFHAVSDICSHGEWSLSDGFVNGDRIECSLHMAEFCLKTGKACKLPATEPIRIYRVDIVGSDVCIDFSSGHYPE